MAEISNNIAFIKRELAKQGRTIKKDANKSIKPEQKQYNPCKRRERKSSQIRSKRILNTKK